MTERLIRIREVTDRTALGRATIYNRMRDGLFPKQRDLGGGVVAWLESEINDWIASRPAASSDNEAGVGVGVAA